MTCRFPVPPEPSYSLDFGNASAAFATAWGTSSVDHTYTSPGGNHPWLFVAQLSHVASGIVCGSLRFELPTSPYRRGATITIRPGSSPGRNRALRGSQRTARGPRFQAPTSNLVRTGIGLARRSAPGNPRRAQRASTGIVDRK
jgi:hypothetical protein